MGEVISLLRTAKHFCLQTTSPALVATRKGRFPSPGSDAPLPILCLEAFNDPLGRERGSSRGWWLRPAPVLGVSFLGSVPGFALARPRKLPPPPHQFPHLQSGGVAWFYLHLPLSLPVSSLGSTTAFRAYPTPSASFGVSCPLL